ncbi:MAG: hypothetical protein ACTSQY_09445 [Candidatus Odinarchaeia archaeon]
MFFKDYQVKAPKSTWESKEGMSSRDVWEAVGSDSISRASIINFLNNSLENDLPEINHITGKGGHRGIYKPMRNEAETKEYLRKVFNEKLDAL